MTTEMDRSKHYVYSSFREKLLEHIFIAELLKRSWLEGSCSIEIAKSEVDSAGHDLIVEAEGIIRHVQLKASAKGSKTPSQKIHIALAEKPSGCVVWIVFDENTLELGPFRFFGGSAGQKLPSLDAMPVAKHTKGNAKGEKLERPQIRVIKKAEFKELSSFDELYHELFQA